MGSELVVPLCDTKCGAAPTSPSPGVGGEGVYVQSAFATLTEDFSTTSAAFVPVDAVAVTMTTGAGFLLIQFALTFLGPNPGQSIFNAFFSVRVDGVQVVRRGSIGTSDSGTSQEDAPTVTALGRVAVGAGTHTIALFAATDGGVGNPLRIPAGSNPQQFGADLLVQEVRA